MIQFKGFCTLGGNEEGVGHGRKQGT